MLFCLVVETRCSQNNTSSSHISQQNTQINLQITNTQHYDKHTPIKIEQTTYTLTYTSRHKTANPSFKRRNQPSQLATNSES